MRKTGKRLGALLLAAVMILSLLPMTALGAEGAASSGTTFNVLDYGADPTGVRESSHAVRDAIAAAKAQNGAPTTVVFPKGEYHFYADYSEVRKLYVTNTVGTDQRYTQKHLGILLENMSNVTIDGGGSLFIFHGDVTTLATIGCTNITFQNFSIDHASPEVVDVTVESKVEGENAVIAYIPPCYNYEIRNGNSIHWMGEVGPETGTPYWQGNNDLAEWGQMYDMKDGVTTRAGGIVSGGALFRSNVSSITEQGNNRVKITYNNAGSLPKVGTCYQIRETTRTTAGMFFWKSDGITLQHMKVHYLHGFGVVGQLSKNFTFDDVDFSAREGTGRTSAGFADFIQMSSVGGKVTITNCNFSNPHDDPINIHGTFLVVKEVSSDKKTFKLRYMHDETAGFPQYYKGDTVDFSTYGTMIPVANSERTVVDVKNPPEDATDNETLRTITITVDQPVEGIVADGHVVENVTYTPEVLIENCRFAQTPTRGVLVTTRKPVVIRDNYFDRMGMAAIFISCDAQSWYESGRAEDVTIENNTFIIQPRFRGDALADAGILVGPTNKSDDPNRQIHSNISLKNNTFYMARDVYAIWAKSVNHLTVEGNTFLRYEPNVTLSLSAASQSVTAGGSQATSLSANGAQYQNKLFHLQACKDVAFTNNTYDDGLNLGVGLASVTTAGDVTVTGDDLSVGGDKKLPAVANVQYFSSDPSVATVDAHGVVHGVSAGTAKITAYTVSGGRIFEAEPLTFTVTGSGTPAATPAKIEVTSAHDTLSVGDTENFSAAVTDSSSGTISTPVAWSVKNAADGAAVTGGAAIDASGQFSATQYGVYEVVATQGGVSGSKIVTVSKPKGLNDDKWTVERTTSDTDWSLDDSTGKVSIKAQSGGDWGSGDTGAHDFFFLETTPENDFVITVKLDTDTCQQSCWCESGLAAWKDKDNYVTVVRKNNGGTNNKLAVNYESTGDVEGHEILKNDIADAAVYLKLEKTGNEYKGYYSATGGDGTWTLINDTETVSKSMSGYKIGFYATNKNNNHAADHRFVLENFTLDGHEVPLVSTNQAPAASGATLTPGSGSVALSYSYSDPDSDAETGSVIVWYVSDAQDGNYTRVAGSAVSSDGKTLTVDAATGGKWVKAVVVPMDSKGRPGAPVTAAAVQAPQQASVPDDATLSSLSVSNGSLVPAFDPAVTSYTVTLPSGAASVDIAAAATQAGASVSGAGNVSLTGTETTATVTVTAANGATTKEYVVKIKRAASADASLSALSVAAGSERISYSSSTRYYQLVADADVSNLELSLTPAATGATVAVRFNGKEWGNYSEAMRLPLLGGQNELELLVTAPDGVSVAIYRVVIVKYASNVATLASLTVNGGNNLLPLEESTAVEVTGNTATINATPTNAGAAVTIRAGSQEVENNTPFDLTENSTEVTIRVVAEDGTTQEEYALSLVKSDPTNADLLALDLGGLTLSPTFGPETLNYTATSHGVASLALTAKTAQSGARVAYRTEAQQQGSGTGSVSGDIALYSNITNKVTVTVTSPDGNTTKNYTVTVTADPTVYLSDIDWTSATAEVGVESGRVPLKDKAWENNPMSVIGQGGTEVTFDKGIGTHAASNIIYDLGGKYKTFTAKVSVGYAKYNHSEAPQLRFIVKCDGTAQSTKEMDCTTPYEEITVELQGVNALELVTETRKTGKGALWSAHGNWADAKLLIDIPEYNSSSVVAVTGVTLNKTSADLTVGDTEELNATITPGNASNKTVDWTSSNEAVATVNQSGVVTAVGAGRATITATTADGRKTATCAVTVTAAVTPPDPVNKEALTNVITAANAAKNTAGLQTKPDGTPASQVDKGTKFVTAAEMQALTDAITAAQAVADNTNATQTEVDSAKDALNAAVTAFNRAIKTGTKETGTTPTPPNPGPSGGGSSSSRPSTPSTEKRDDGNWVTTETKPGGTKIETVEQRDGTTAERVTDPKRNVTITVTDENGEELAKVEIPAVLPKAETKFDDVPEGHWAEDAIQTAVALGISKGVGDNKYDLAAPMTRGSLAAVLHRLSQGKTDYAVTFKDVAKGKYYTEGVAWAARANVVKGVSEDVFAPDQVITREQLAVMMARYAKLIGMNTKANTKALEKFSDGSKTGAWAVDGVAWCVENGILQGKGGAILDASANVTRAEVAVMLQRFIKLMK